MKFSRMLWGRHKGVESGANGIAVPTSRHFDRQAWEAAYRSLTDGSPEDRSVFEAGCFVEDELKIVRDALGDLHRGSRRQTASQRLTSLVGVLNMKGLGAMGRLRDLVQQQGNLMPLEQMLFARVIEGPGGSAYTVEEVMQMLTDCMRHPMRGAIHQKGHGAAHEGQPVFDEDDELEISAQLAAHYDSFEHLWASACWLGAGFLKMPQEAVFDEIRGPLSTEEMLNRSRRSFALSKDSFEAAEEQRRLAASIVRPYGVLVLDAQDGQTLRFERFEEAPELVQRAATTVLTAWMLTSDVDYDALFAMRHSKLKCTVGELLNIWVQLVVLAAQCKTLAEGRMPEKYGSTPPTDPVAIASFDRAELMGLIAKATRLGASTVSVALGRFTFGQDGLWTSELWDRPLVLADDRLLLAWYPLVSCHFGRLIAALVKDCQEAMDAYAKRGHHFENHVVVALRAAARLSTNALLREAIVLAARLDPKDERTGDVDCVVVLGDTAFCMECRSVKQAATAYEQWDVADDLKANKAEQAVRKRDYLKRNPGLLAQAAAAQGTPLLQPVTRFVALVVSNCYLFEGAQQSEPYFLHVDTVVNMLLGGPLFQSFDDQGRAMGHLVDYFRNDTIVGDAVRMEFRSPAKAEYYRALTKPIRVFLPGLHPDGTPVHVAQLALDPAASDTVLDVLKGCSFGSRLRTISADEWAQMEACSPR